MFYLSLTIVTLCGPLRTVKRERQLEKSHSRACSSLSTPTSEQASLSVNQKDRRQYHTAIQVYKFYINYLPHTFSDILLLLLIIAYLFHVVEQSMGREASMK